MEGKTSPESPLRSWKRSKKIKTTKKSRFRKRSRNKKKKTPIGPFSVVGYYGIVLWYGLKIYIIYTNNRKPRTQLSSTGCGHNSELYISAVASSLVGGRRKVDGFS